MRKRLILAVAALILSLSTWAAPALAQACYGESYSSYSYGGGACYSGSYSYGYGYGIGPAYSTTGSVYYAAPTVTVGSRLAYRAFHPLAGLRGRFAARRALRGTYGVGAACYSEGYAYGAGCYSGGACYSASYGGYASYYAAPVSVAYPAYALAYQPATWAAPANCPNGFCPQVRPNGGMTPAPAPMPAPMPSPMPSPQSGAGAGTGTHPCPCGDAACNHTLGACPCTDPQCKCHLPGPSNPHVAPVVPPSPNVTPHHPDRDRRP
jgi:hypothetical protein